jgi:hypothetical protein
VNKGKKRTGAPDKDPGPPVRVKGEPAASEEPATITATLRRRRLARRRTPGSAEEAR